MFRPEQLSDDVWDYIFFKDKPIPTDSGIDSSVLRLVNLRLLIGCSGNVHK